MQHKFLKCTVFILAVTFVFALVSCHSGSKDPASVSTAEESAPEEKQIYLPYTLVDHTENCKYTYTYNAYGNEIRKVKENANGDFLAAWSNEYDEHQNLIKTTVDTGDGTPFVQRVQTYDDKGNLLERREYTTNDETVITYQYDEQSRVISRKVGETVTETYAYAEDGSYRVQSASNPDEYRNYDPDGKVTESHLSATKKVIYSYNDAGVLTEAATYSGNEITQKKVYQLDEHGNPMQVTQVFASGTETVLYEYVYQLYTVKADQP